MCKNNEYFANSTQKAQKKAHYSLKKRCFRQFTRAFSVFLHQFNAIFASQFDFFIVCADRSHYRILNLPLE